MLLVFGKFYLVVRYTGLQKFCKFRGHTCSSSHHYDTEVMERVTKDDWTQQWWRIISGA